ncbi:hypothetical protein D3C73_1275800 [compost metagenome]
MAKNPEYMLPEHRIPACADLEEISPENPVEGKQYKPYSNRRKSEQDNSGSDKSGPGEHRHPHVGHSRRAHRNDRSQEVNAPD